MMKLRVADTGVFVFVSAATLFGPSVAHGESLQTAQPGQTQVVAEDGTTLKVVEGHVVVPESRDRAQSGKTIDIAYVRIGRETRRSSIGHIILAGGPGDAGVELVHRLARSGGTTLFDLLDGDLIGIDQRGTGRSRPNLDSRILYDLPIDRAASMEAWLPLMEKAVHSAVEEFRARGIRLEAYNTRESASDIDDVRRALGYERVIIWGRSYGSHLALAVLRQHPQAIDRVILANPEGPDHTLKLPSRADDVVKRLSRLVAAHPSLGPRIPDLERLMRDVFEQLDRQEAIVTIPHPLTGSPLAVAVGKLDVQLLTAQALGDPRTVATVPAAFLAMRAGNFRNIAQLVVMQRQRMGVQSAMKHMMDHSSGASDTRRLRIERETASSVLGNAINLPNMLLRRAWGNPDLGATFREAVQSKAPVLVLAGDLDPRTPVENARELLEHLPNGHLIVIGNATHQFDLFGSAPIRAVLEQFLRGTRLTTDRLELSAPAFQSPMP